jgi:hypothetical protein
VRQWQRTSHRGRTKNFTPSHKKTLDNPDIMCYNKARKNKGDKKMNEYTIYNIYTKEEDILFGYSIIDAYRRRGKDREAEQGKGWIVLRSEYID